MADYREGLRPPHLNLSLPLADLGSIALAAMLLGGFLGGLVLLIIVFALWLWHRRKMAEINVQTRGRVSEETRAAIEELRMEIAALKDTTTQYDMSFDSALHRLESRMAHMEQKVSQVQEAPQSLQLGRS